MRVKWLCPKSKKVIREGRTQYILSCENPCTSSPCGRIYHPTINKDLRLNCPVPRNTEKCTNLYKIRTITERTNNIIKHPLGLSTLKINKKDKMLSIKSLVA